MALSSWHGLMEQEGLDWYPQAMIWLQVTPAKHEVWPADVAVTTSAV